MPLITFLYLGVLLKVYVLKSVTWVQISPVSLAPFVLCYGYELSCEFFKNALNFKRKRPHLHAMLAETKDSDSKERKHSATTLKVNLGLLPNFLLIATYNYGFFLLLCLRLDKRIKLSYFIILIPVWVLMLYFTVFATFVGVASRNDRANTCEKVFVSLLVPLGFFATLVLVICYIEGYLKPEAIAYLFLP